MAAIIYHTSAPTALNDYLGIDLIYHTSAHTALNLDLDLDLSDRREDP